MRKVILNVAVSLDFMIAGPNGEYDWCFTDQDYGMSDFMKRIDSLFMGSKTYELLLKVDPNSFPGFKRYVFSNSLKEIADAQLIRGNWKATVDTILQTEGKDIWLFGGADLTHHFLQNNLIDEMSLAVHPIILGEGKPLFHSLRERKKFILKETKTFSSGLVQLCYTKLQLKSEGLFKKMAN